MPVVHILTNGIKFRRNDESRVVIDRAPDRLQTNGLLEDCLLFGIKSKHQDGSVIEIVDIHSCTDEVVTAFLENAAPPDPTCRDHAPFFHRRFF
jgi:hypothetical protein